MNYMTNYMNNKSCMPNTNSQSVRPLHNYNNTCTSASQAVYDNRHTADCCPDTASSFERNTCNTQKIPTGNQKQLFHFINEVSFAAYEALLFLDTHPDDQDALVYFHKYNHLRNADMKEYAHYYGPLTISTADDCSSKCWEWMNQPWPWEGGIC